MVSPQGEPPVTVRVAATIFLVLAWLAAAEVADASRLMQVVDANNREISRRQARERRQAECAEPAVGIDAAAGFRCGSAPDAEVDRLRDAGCAFRTGVVEGNGGKQALYNAAMCLFGAGDEVITHMPGWPTLVEQVKLADATPVTVRT